MTQADATTAMDRTLHDLIDKSWREYTEHCPSDFVVSPSIPILFFGDLQRYLASPIRVVTVGLNPSRAEFPITSPHKDRLQRFPEARGIDAIARGATFDRQYIATLSDYFRTDPLMRWFNAYEHILNGMDGSYRDGARNTALHTDICSPLATDPTWSGLLPDHKATLESHGTALWHRLITYLAPTILLVSIARGRRDKISFQTITEWETVYTIERENPYIVLAKRIRVVDSKETYIIFGPAANTPFGTVSNKDKGIIGACVKEYIDG